MTDLRGVAVRLHGPLQSWGAAAVGDDRPSLGFPTRSGVLGLVAACLGIRRADTEGLLALADGARVHVRVDSPGKPIVDDQTVQGHPVASGTRQTIQSKRTYLCDASFVAVVVPGPRASLDELARALAAPVFTPFLGRRSCVPSSRLLLAPKVSGQDPLDLFTSLPRGPADLIDELRSRGSLTDDVDYFLDMPENPWQLRRVPVRDDFRGPLRRQWRERFALHVRNPSS